VKRRWLLRIALWSTIPALVPVIITENTVRLHEHPQPDPTLADSVAHNVGAQWRSLRIAAPDGARLDSWLFTPREPNGAAVMVLHGIGDTRAGVSHHVLYLLRAGFTVLAPDSRGHGASGGRLLTFGIQEASDVRAWADALLRESHASRLYGLGESMGAAILIQSLPKEPRLRAIVAECPFSTFEEVAYYRLEQMSHLGRWASWPTTQAGFFYARVRYGVDLHQASPARAIQQTRTPILLIHGLSDVNIPPSQSQRLQSLNPQSATLWLVPGAVHVSAIGAAPEEYVKRVTDWFRQ
jgi:dipeptidyl aminopeptidase/acylaminoacyl peptidase